MTLVIYGILSPEGGAGRLLFRVIVLSAVPHKVPFICLCSFVTVLKHWRRTIWSAGWLVFSMLMPLNSTAVYIQFHKSSCQSLIISSFYWVGRRKDRLENIPLIIRKLGSKTGSYLLMKGVYSHWKIMVLTWECFLILWCPGSSFDDSGFLCLV